jgi:hypothetical protein
LFRIHESGSDSESLILTESKNTNFTKIGGTKKNHGPNSRDTTSRTQRPSSKFFSKAKFVESLEFFLESLHRNLSEKLYMSQQITWNFRVIQHNSIYLFQFSANFSFGAKFYNEVPKILCSNFNRIIYN